MRPGVPRQKRDRATPGPPRDPLHERIGCHQSQAGERDQLGRQIELKKHDQPDEAKEDQPQRRRAFRHTPAGDGSARRTGDFCVKIGIDDIVVDASRAAHRDAAKKEPPEPRPLPARSRQPDAPRTRPEQQPPPDGSIEPRQQRVIADRLRKTGHHTAVFAVGDGDIVHRTGPFRAVMACPYAH